VLLYINVPIEIVSELLRHSNMSITQEYSRKVVMKKVSEEVKKLNRRI
jgi:integrase